MCVCVCVWHRGVLSATRGPCCRLLPYPRILLGASHTWVAHSSWALHIQIAVMNIIREEHRGDVQGTLSLSLYHTQTHTHTYSHMWVHIHICQPTHKWVYAVYCHAHKTWSLTCTCGLTCMVQNDRYGCTCSLTCIPLLHTHKLSVSHTHTYTHTHTYRDVRHLIFTSVLSVPRLTTSSTGQPARPGPASTTPAHVDHSCWCSNSCIYCTYCIYIYRITSQGKY